MISLIELWTTGPCYTFIEDSHNTGNFMPCSFRIVCGFFPRNCEHSVILRPWVLVRLESNSRAPAGQTVAQPTEPLVRETGLD